jgi:tRNA(Arg) A34 adenosine deaminase TadA
VCTRRSILARIAVALAFVRGSRIVFAAERAGEQFKPEQRWMEAAAAMRRIAVSRGDQPYGAVLVADGAIIGEGPSRVIQRNDATAHAEREAIRDAQARLGRADLAGSILYSTSHPCRQCEIAAAQANVARMIYGEALDDAGWPKR